VTKRTENPAAESPAAPAADPPESELRARLLGQLPSLSPKRRRLATAVLDEPFTVAVSTAEELGEQLGIDRATIVRFSRSLGYAGFSDLKDAIRSDMPHFMTATEKLRRRLFDRNENPASFQSTMAQDIRNIEAAVALNSDRLLSDAAAAIAASSKVLVLGSGMSGPVAHLLAHLLSVNGIPAAHRPDQVMAAAEIASLDRASAVIAIGFWRLVRSTVRLFDVAAERTETTIAITDSHSAPLARTARYTLIAPSDAEAINNSVTAAIALVNALVTAIAARGSERAYSHSKHVDEVYASAEITAE
jgi:DNA-binding MurR/RpiR family transcriptional regulator